MLLSEPLLKQIENASFKPSNNINMSEKEDLFSDVHVMNTLDGFNYRK